MRRSWFADGTESERGAFVDKDDVELGSDADVDDAREASLRFRFSLLDDGQTVDSQRPGVIFVVVERNVADDIDADSLRDSILFGDEVIVFLDLRNVGFRDGSAADYGAVLVFNDKLHADESHLDAESQTIVKRIAPEKVIVTVESIAVERDALAVARADRFQQQSLSSEQRFAAVSRSDAVEKAGKDPRINIRADGGQFVCLESVNS